MPFEFDLLISGHRTQNPRNQGTRKVGSVAGHGVDHDLARYHLLASAMVGRAVRVEPAPSEEESYTDGHAIYLARGADWQADLSALAVQSALLAAGSLDVAVMRQLLGRPSVARRYLAV